MSILSKIRKREKVQPRKAKDPGHQTFLDFLQDAAVEIDSIIASSPNWYRELPYRAPISPDEARKLEIEKRAIWRRVIYDAKRTKLIGLQWESSKDEQVCTECRKLEGKIFRSHEYDALSSIRMHVGCRCTLAPIRDSDSHR